MCCWLDGPFWSAPRNLQVSNIAGDCLLCGDEGARQDSVFIKKRPVSTKVVKLGSVLQVQEKA